MKETIKKAWNECLKGFEYLDTQTGRKVYIEKVIFGFVKMTDGNSIHIDNLNNRYKIIGQNYDN